MGRLLRLEEIDEFSLVRRVPRAAITSDILRGVGTLSEVDQIEPFVREILSDPTKTAHTSTEIADILTPHLTCSGRPRLAAFVNKGRATRKVSSKEVAHQLVRLRQVPQLGLVVLLAVGDIQDDAKRDLLQIADDAGADSLIIDATDVARLFIVYQKLCPKDGTPYATGRCPACGTLADEPIELTLSVLEPLRYELLSLRDVSHNQAKRYRADVWADPHYPRAALYEVVKEVTWELRRSTYYRSELTEARFGEQEADCVFLFVYVDRHDVQQANWRCRAQWVRPGLPEAARPLRLGSTTWLGEIEVEWNEAYEARRDLVPCTTKQEWVQKVDNLSRKAEERAEAARRLLEALDQGKMAREAFEREMAELEVEAGKLFREAGSDKLPPLECEACDQAFKSMMGHCHNVFVFFARWSQVQRDWDNKMWGVRTYLKQYDADRGEFLHEWHKVR